MKPETTSSMADELNLMTKKRRRELISITLKWAFLMDIYLFGQQLTDRRTKCGVNLLKHSVYFLYARPFIGKNLIIYKTPESKLFFLAVRVHECFACLLLLT